VNAALAASVFSNDTICFLLAQLFVLVPELFLTVARINRTFRRQVAKPALYRYIVEHMDETANFNRNLWNPMLPTFIEKAFPHIATTISSAVRVIRMTVIVPANRSRILQLIAANNMVNLTSLTIRDFPTHRHCGLGQPCDAYFTYSDLQTVTKSCSALTFLVLGCGIDSVNWTSRQYEQFLIANPKITLNGQYWDKDREMLCVKCSDCGSSRLGYFCRGCLGSYCCGQPGCRLVVSCEMDHYAFCSQCLPAARDCFQLVHCANTECQRLLCQLCAYATPTVAGADCGHLVFYCSECHPPAWSPIDPVVLALLK
jgi:hypothetical protein